MNNKKTLYLWDLGDTLFIEKWNQEKTGFSSFNEWVEDKLGVDISGVSPRKYEEMYEIPYHQGWHFNLDIEPGFLEALALSEYNEAFTSGTPEQINWRAEYLQDIVGFDIRLYLQKVNSTFDFKETNIKDEDMYYSIFLNKVKEGHDTIVYSDDKIKYLEQCYRAGERIKKEYPGFELRLYQMINKDVGLTRKEYYWEAGSLFDVVNNEKSFK